MHSVHSVHCTPLLFSNSVIKLYFEKKQTKSCVGQLWLITDVLVAINEKAITRWIINVLEVLLLLQVTLTVLVLALC